MICSALLLFLWMLQWMFVNGVYYSYGFGIKDWALISTYCGGKRQSPIDVNTSAVKVTRGNPPLELMNLNVNPIGVTARNTGRAAHFTLTYPSSRSLLLVGGSLQGTFAFAGIHFHWSSEHTIDQQQFPIEMHLVFFNRMYNSLAEAAFHDNGLAVVGFFFTNNALAKSRRWMDSLKNIRRRRSSYTFVHPESINLARLVGTEIGEHFEYLGSLTIPPCYETVTWIIRKKPLLISNMQLSLFRSLESDEGLMNNNNRPLQNLNNRTVWMSSK